MHPSRAWPSCTATWSQRLAEVEQELQHCREELQSVQALKPVLDRHVSSNLTFVLTLDCLDT
mgnify:CR=1 FL=1